MCFLAPFKISSWFLYDLSKPRTRSCGLSRPSDLRYPRAPRSRFSIKDDRPSQSERQGDLLRDEPQTIFSIKKPWRFVAVSWTESRPKLGSASSALKIYANETNREAHRSFRWTGVAARISCSEQSAARSLLLTPNARLRGAGVRSTEASAPLAG